MSNLIILRSNNSSCTISLNHGAHVHKLSLSSQKGVLVEIVKPSKLAEISNWPDGGIPILFPTPGRVYYDNKKDRYKPSPEAEVYSMPMHGFIQNQIFTLHQNISTSEVELKSTDNLTTRRIYPYNFTLLINYKLTTNSLNISLKITNTTPSSLMPFALGLHPYFKTKHNWEKILIPQHKSFSVNTKGLKGTKLQTNNKDFQAIIPPLNNIIMTSLANTEAVLAKQNRPSLQLTWSNNFKNIVCWSNKLSNFFCVEPWTNFPNAINHHNKNLTQLQENETAAFNFTMSLQD